MSESKRRFYINELNLEILSQEPIPDEILYNLEELKYREKIGQYSIDYTTGLRNHEEGGRSTAMFLNCHGEDSKFFGLTQDGEDLK